MTEIGMRSRQQASEAWERIWYAPHPEHAIPVIAEAIDAAVAEAVEAERAESATALARAEGARDRWRDVAWDIVGFEPEDDEQVFRTILTWTGKFHDYKQRAAAADAVQAEHARLAARIAWLEAELATRVEALEGQRPAVKPHDGAMFDGRGRRPGSGPPVPIPSHTHTLAVADPAALTARVGLQPEAVPMQTVSQMHPRPRP